jgi:hypothetical protein
MRNAMTRLWGVLGLVALVAAAPRGQTTAPGRTPGLGTAGGVTVSGRIVEIYPGVATPTPPARVLLRVDPSKAGRVLVVQSVVVNADGTFAFDNVAPGPYRVLAAAGPGLPEVSIQVGTNPVRDVEVPFTVPLPVTVTLSMDDGSPVPTVEGGFYRFQIARTSDANVVYGAIDINRTVPIGLVPGEYHVFVRPPDGLYVRSLRTGMTDLRREPFTLVPGGRGLMVETVISRMAPADAPMGRIRGRITGNHGGIEIGLADVTVPGPLTRNPTRFATARADGTFEFADLPPGRYDIDVPPARSVTPGVVVAGKDVDVLVEVPEGQIVAGVVSGFSDAGGERRPGPPGALTLRFTGGPVARTKRVARPLFWDALPPGEYRVTVEELEPGTSVETLRAGSVDLLTRPFVVPASRPPEAIAILLRAMP